MGAGVWHLQYQCVPSLFLHLLPRAEQQPQQVGVTPTPIPVLFAGTSACDAGDAVWQQDSRSQTKEVALFCCSRVLRRTLRERGGGEKGEGGPLDRVGTGGATRSHP
jgi:hypothetical protein